LHDSCGHAVGFALVGVVCPAYGELCLYGRLPVLLPALHPFGKNPADDAIARRALKREYVGRNERRGGVDGFH
jgi:hypothetical protein